MKGCNMNENEFSQSPKSFNDQDILDQIADLIGEIDAKQADMDANVIDQANAAVEDKINSGEVASILEDKLEVVFEGVLARLNELAKVRETARTEKLAAIDAGDQATAESIVTKVNEEEWSEAMRITRNIGNYLNRRSELPAPDREHSVRVLLEDIRQFLEMRQGK